MPKIILIGFMGCGKTTLGKLLSNALNVPFLDTDVLIESQTNKTIKELFNAFGEEHFRQLETDLLSEIKKKQQFVMATGGGLPCFGTNMNTLNELGATVYLKTSVNELCQRLTIASSKRPLLGSSRSEDLKATINSLIKTRETVYYQCHHVLKTDGKSEKELIDSLIDISREERKKL